MGVEALNRTSIKSRHERGGALTITSIVGLPRKGDLARVSPNESSKRFTGDTLEKQKGERDSVQNHHGATYVSLVNAVQADQ